jgi:hypothetical protein
MIKFLIAPNVKKERNRVQMKKKINFVAYSETTRIPIVYNSHEIIRFSDELQTNIQLNTKSTLLTVIF